MNSKVGEVTTFLLISFEIAKKPRASLLRARSKFAIFTKQSLQNTVYRNEMVIVGFTIVNICNQNNRTGWWSCI